MKNITKQNYALKVLKLVVKMQLHFFSFLSLYCMSDCMSYIDISSYYMKKNWESHIRR